MKKCTIKTRIALSLLFCISMVSASDRSWRNYSLKEVGHGARKYANDAFEAGKKYAQPVYNAARNNPRTAAAIGVGVGVAPIAYFARARIRAGWRRGINQFTGNDKKIQAQALENIKRYTTLSLKHYLNDADEQQKNFLLRNLTIAYETYKTLEFPSTTEQKILKSLQEWRYNMLINQISRSREEEKEANELEQALR